MLNLERMTFSRHPYPVGFAAPVLDEAIYDAMTDACPSLDECHECPTTPKGRTLRNRVYAFAPEYQCARFQQFVSSSPLWSRWDAYLRGPAFVAQVRELLARHGIPAPGLDHTCYLRWTFLLLDGGGGFLAPHTDSAHKLVTLILSMRRRDDDWDHAWRGGTDILEPLDPAAVQPAYAGRFEDFRIVRTYPYGHNQCVLFTKSDLSWHSVGPLAAPDGHVRKAMIVNIENRPRSC